MKSGYQIRQGKNKGGDGDWTNFLVINHHLMPVSYRGRLSDTLGIRMEGIFKVRDSVSVISESHIYYVTYSTFASTLNDFHACRVLDCQVGGEWFRVLK